MNNVNTPRYLITTADERTWKFDRPVLFLGEWCRHYNREKTWSNMDAVVAKPYGLEEKQRENDHAFIEKEANKLLTLLADVLNEYHATNHSLRYWRIMLGHWLYRYTSVIVNRWNTLKNAIDDHELSGATFFDSNAYSLATRDSISFIRACDDDVWDNVLCSKILTCIMGETLNIETQSLDGESEFVMDINSPVSDSLKIKQLPRKIISGFLKIMARDNDAFIINSYFSKKLSIRLQLSLGQIPQLWESPKPELIKSNSLLRERLILDMSDCQGLERCLRSLLIEILPTCYIEGYSRLKKQVNSLPWPKKPKFIFTSNSFDTDEAFKVWAGLKVDQGVPYYTGQHGNNHGTLKHCLSDVECEATSDKFITWGWSDGSTKHAPAFIFKAEDSSKQKYDPQGSLLLIELYVQNRVFSWDTYAEFNNYQEEQFCFVECLPENIYKSLVVRLHEVRRWHKWFDIERWKDRAPEAIIDGGLINIQTLVSRSRLVVHSYDSTGLLETLYQNIPTISFWQNNMEHLRESAKPYYQLLVDAGIVHLTPVSAASHVNKVWDDIEGWWETNIVQDARKKFCERYAKVSQTPVRDLRKIVLQDSCGI